MMDLDGGAEALDSGALACVPPPPRPRKPVRVKRKYERRAYEVKVAAVQRACRRIEAGWSVTDVCREADMPQRSTFVAWLAANPELRAMVEAAQAAAAEVFTPRRDYHYWDEDVAAEFLARIEDGRGLREVCAEPDMPVHATVLRWMKERPAFEAAYRRAREAQADRLFDLAWRIACEATEGDVATSRLKIQTLKWRVEKLAPRVYGPMKAQEPPGSGAAAGSGKIEHQFQVRSWARTPDNQVVETTDAVLGMTAAERQALYDGVRSGRLSLDALAALNAAGRAADRG